MENHQTKREFNFASTLKFCREKADFSISQLSQVAGIQQQIITKIEDGEIESPKVAILKRLSQAMNIPIGLFLLYSEVDLMIKNDEIPENKKDMSKRQIVFLEKLISCQIKELKK